MEEGRRRRRLNQREIGTYDFARLADSSMLSATK
jgi:hypothetical protein